MVKYVDIIKKFANLSNRRIANMDYTKIDGRYLTYEQKKTISKFLYEHLDEYRDSLEDICACLDYLTDSEQSGEVYLAQEEKNIAGCVVINHTGMSKYIPENILVYIAVDKNYRGQGVGKKLMKQAIEQTNGNIALHVEPNNPAKNLYENLGFTSKYLEMRYMKDC